MTLLLSVIIPTRNRAQRLADLLDSLARQDSVEFEWEVIVVDNASTDMTHDIAQQKRQALSIPIRYIFESQLGLHNGRHRGAKEARGKFLGYLDDDMILAPTWIQGVGMVAQRQADAVVGRILPKWEAQPPDWLLALAQDGLYGYLGLIDLGGIRKRVDPYSVFGGNCFLPRLLIFELGGFHPDSMPTDLLRYRGDGETALMMKFKQRGLNSYYDPSATAFHIIDASRLTVEYICQRAYNQGISDSFTQIRVVRGLAELPFPPSNSESLCQRIREKSATEIARAILRRGKKVMGLSKKKPYAEIHSKIEAAYRAGWRFHQNEVRNDSTLLEYVLRETYLE